MRVTPSQAIAQLATNPSSFLRKYPVRIFGDPKGSHVASYRIEDSGDSTRPGRRVLSSRRDETQRFDIRPRGVAFGNPAGSVWFDAHSVKMFEGRSPYEIGVYTLPAREGPNLMVTGQLSGCSFAIRDNGDGSYDVTHIRPNAQLPGEVLQGY